MVCYGAAQYQTFSITVLGSECLPQKAYLGEDRRLYHGIQKMRQQKISEIVELWYTILYVFLSLRVKRVQGLDHFLSFTTNQLVVIVRGLEDDSSAEMPNALSTRQHILNLCQIAFVDYTRIVIYYRIRETIVSWYQATWDI